jgi:hypothetical protein
LRRFWRTVGCLLALTACRIEQTPQQYIDRQDSPADQMLASEAENTRRLASLSGALEGRNLVEVGGALNLDPEAVVVGLSPGAELRRADETAAALDSIVGGASLSSGDIAVTVGPQNDLAWFQAEFASVDPELGSGFQFSGVFRRVEGEWRLLQGHISPTLAVPSPQEEGDRTQAEGG